VEAKVAKALVKAIVNRLDTTTITVATITSRTEEEDTKAKDPKDTKAD